MDYGNPYGHLVIAVWSAEKQESRYSPWWHLSRAVIALATVRCLALTMIEAALIAAIIVLAYIVVLGIILPRRLRKRLMQKQNERQHTRCNW